MRGRYFFIILGLTPILAYYALFFVYPVISSFSISLHKWPLLRLQRPFVGFRNYAWALQDRLFWVSARNTLYFTLGWVAINTILALALALLITSLSAPLFKTIFRTAFFIPVVCSMSAVTIIFRWLFNPSFGALNHLLGYVGLGPFKWLTSSVEVMPSIILVSVWKSLGFTMVIFMAGLTTIPEQLYEAARIDGASARQVFFRITLPLLQPTMLFVLVTGVIEAMQMFTQVHVLTDGGPGSASLVIVKHLYNYGFQYLKMGQASAIAFILFGWILLVTLLQIRFFREGFEY
jgi:ABC-type sugar transport system permease subunit